MDKVSPSATEVIVDILPNLSPQDKQKLALIAQGMALAAGATHKVKE